MTIVETSGKPFVFNDTAVFTLNGIKLNCILNKLGLKPDVTKVTSTTLCAAVDYPGATKWVLSATLYQSFQDDGAYEVLSGAYIGGVPVPYTIQFHTGIKSQANPEFSGMVVPQAFDIIDSDAGALVEIAIEWGCDGAPMEDTGTGPVPIGTAAAAGLMMTNTAPSSSSSSGSSGSAATPAA